MSDFNVSSVGGNFDILAHGTDFDDLVFLQFVSLMHQIDVALGEKIAQIKATNERKQEIAHEMAALNKALERSSARADHPNDLVYVEGGLQDPIDPAKGRFATAEEQQAYEREVKDYRNNPLKNPVFPEFAKPFGPCYSKEQIADYENAPVFRRGDVQARIEELQQELDKLSADQEVNMVDLQRLMNKRSEATQFTSNVVARSHDNAMGIIANLK